MNRLVSIIKENNDVEEILCCYEVCSLCKGECCKKSGCHISPDDLKDINIDIINELLNTGMVLIDWWVGYENKVLDLYLDKAYYLKIAHIGSKEISNGIGGQCVLLTDTGCPLKFKYRPKGARRLNCYKIRHTMEQHRQLFGDKAVDNYSIEQCLGEWLPYQDLLEQIKNDRDKKGEYNDC